jgi:hypothetical protein
MSLRHALVLFAVVLCLGLAVAAQEEEPAAGHAEEMTPEMAAAMAAWQKAMTPGPPHERLAAQAGEWKIEVTMWMEPGAPPMVSEGTASRQMVMGGRHLQEDVVSTFMGMPFEGRAVSGYDNVTGKYWSTWVDNMSTGLMSSEGTWDEATATGTFVGTVVDPLTGAEKEVKNVMRIVSPDKEVHEMWDTVEGEPYKSMEIVYQRQ